MKTKFKKNIYSIESVNPIEKQRNPYRFVPESVSSMISFVIRKKWHVHGSLPLMGLMLTVAMLTAACEERFEPFNQVDRFRILGLKADPPDLTEGQMTTITPLIHTDSDKPLTYEWSWCPIAISARGGGECMVDEEMIKSFAKQQIEDGALDGVEVGGVDADDVLDVTNNDPEELIDSLPLSFDLGTSPTANFIYALPRQMLSDLCDQIVSEGIPSFTGTPTCQTRFNVVIRLAVTQGETTLVGTKQIPLYVDETRAGNRNPKLLDVVVKDGKGKAVGDSLKEGEWYDIRADIGDDSIDTLLPIPTQDDPNPARRAETLFITWYVTGGETDFLRTSYFEEDVAVASSIKTLETNRWRTPYLNELSGDLVTLYLVLQDEQGGAAWISRDFSIERGAK